MLALLTLDHSQTVYGLQRDHKGLSKFYSLWARYITYLFYIYIIFYTLYIIYLYIIYSIYFNSSYPL